MATHFVPNALIAVWRDEPDEEGADAWGQSVPAADPPLDDADATDLPAFISDYSTQGSSSSNTKQPASGKDSTVARYRIRLRPGAFAFSRADRIKNLRTGSMYLVDDVAAPLGSVEASDIRLVCRRVT